MPSKKRRGPTLGLSGLDGRVFHEARASLHQASSDLAETQMHLALELERAAAEIVDRYRDDLIKRTAAYNQQVGELADLLDDINSGVFGECSDDERALVAGHADELRAATVAAPTIEVTVPPIALDPETGQRAVRHVPVEISMGGHVTARVDPEKGHASTTKSPDPPAVRLAYELPVRLG